MRSSIPYYILMLLEMEGQVRVPGIGRLTQSRVPARLRQGNGLIDPPQAGAYLEVSTIQKGKLLERYITYQSGARRKEARQAIAQFGQHIVKEIERSGFAHFPSFGTFSRVNGQIVFEPAAEVVNARYYGLQPVEILRDPSTAPQPTAQPAEQPKHVSQVSPEVLPAAEPAPKVVQETPVAQRQRRAVPVLLIALVALVLATCVFAFVQYKMKQQALAEQALFNRSPVSERVEVPVEKDAQGEQATAEDSAASVLPESEDVESSGQHEAPSSEEATPADTPESPAHETDTEAEADPALPCLIVIGAFGQQANVDRMVTRLQELGWSAVTMPRGELTVVGVPVVCRGTAMQADLSRLRTEVEAQAWLLKR